MIREFFLCLNIWRTVPPLPLRAIMMDKEKNAVKYRMNPKKKPENVPEPTKSLDTKGGVPHNITMMAAFI